MRIGVLRELSEGERRVALTPAVLPQVAKAGATVLIEQGAGLEAGYRDDEYTAAGAEVRDTAEAVAGDADVLMQVRCYPAQLPPDDNQLALLGAGKTCIGLAEPLTAVEPIDQLAATGAMSFALELVPRITRAQTMDVLSSQATIAGYRAVLAAADHLPRMFPMMMTAAGTIAPARVLVIGAGVAGLQAIATARRNGAVVSGYDIRPAVREQVESLGAAFVELDLDTAEAEDKGGYAKAMDESFYKRQQELLGEVIAEQDVVITTAAVPGKTAPMLVPATMVEGMAEGSVIVDLAAERGGNCELSQPGEVVKHAGVTIVGPTNLPAQAPYHASQMYAKNIATFLDELLNEGELNIDLENEVIRDTLLTRDGAIVQPAVLERFGRDQPVTQSVAGGAEQDGEA